MRPGIFHKPLWLVLAAAVFAVGMWTYADRVLIPYQKADAAAHDRPRGNLSDLYPRWVGARELLLHGRDPYSPEVTREIQVGFYGRPLDPSRPDDPRDEEGFAYPVYVVFCLAPMIGSPFAIVQKAFYWALLLLTCATTLIWLRVLRRSAPLWIQISLLALTMGSPAVMQGLKLQQMSLLVAGLIAIAIALLVTDCPSRPDSYWLWRASSRNWWRCCCVGLPSGPWPTGDAAIGWRFRFWQIGRASCRERV